SWPSHWSYDTYDVSSRLRRGTNVIAILVLHYGVGTFQSLPTRGGLLVQLEGDGNILAATDETWKMAENVAYDRATPRITCQLAFTEEFNAFWEQAHLQGIDLDEEAGRKWHLGQAIAPNPVFWQNAGFDDSHWEQAVDVGPVGPGPWMDLSPRDIPFLTEDPMAPANVLRARVVTEADVWAVRLRETLLPGYLDANPTKMCGFLATVVEVGQEIDVTLYTPPMGNYAPGQLRVNGLDVERISGTNQAYDGGFTFTFRLREGKNLLLWDVTGVYHEWSAAYVVETVPPLRGQWSETLPFFVTYGPFESEADADFQAIWNSKSEEELTPHDGYMKQAFRVSDHVMLATAHAKHIASLDTRGYAALCYSTADAVEIAPNPDGDTEILLDFGKMTVGFWELEVDAPEVAIIDLVGFESMQDGQIDMTWGVNNALRYTTRAGLQSYHSVVRRGCRYLFVTVRDLKGPMRIHGIRTLLNTYPCVERGAFQCDDTKLNQIWDMGRWTTRLCSEDTYVDCPTYEQAFWVGDSRNEGAANHYAFGEYALSRHSLILAAQSMERSPLVESQVPSSWENILPTWSLMWVLACEEYYQITGDREFLEEIYPYIKRQNDYCLSLRDDRGLIVLEGWNLLDWAPLDTPGDGVCTHTLSWLVMCLERQSVMAEALGMMADIAPLKAARISLIDSINRHLWDDDRKAYIDCLHADGRPSKCVSQQTNTIVVLAGFAPADREASIRKLLVDRSDGVVGVGSPFFMFFTFEALAKLGEFETILDLTRQWWGLMLDTDASTCWETFPGFEGQGRWTRSHCHAWSAAPTYFQSRYQLGVSPLEAGFQKALIQPETAGLEWAKGRVPTPHGEIGVQWDLRGKRLSVIVALPASVCAEIVLPLDRDQLKEVAVTGAKEIEGETRRPLYVAESGAQVRIEASIR
ncbi:MAG: family 78 glycoside hydrolase catalytic domain, partial [Armatimonadota bacterium]